MTSSRRNKGLLSALLVLGAAPGCIVDYPLENDLLSFQVTLSGDGVEVGTEEDRLTYVSGASCAISDDCEAGETCLDSGFCALELHFDLRAIGRDGELFPYRGPLSVRVTPGEISSPSNTILMDGGEALEVPIAIARGTGKTHVWFEADGVMPLPDGQQYGQCSDGLDNDLNGLVDLADAGCEHAGDDMEAPVNLSTGVSPTFWFDDPKLRDIQFTDDLNQSPLLGEQVTVTAGTLIVTNIVSNGFYALDLADNTPDRLFNALFVFTFSKPQGLSYGQPLCGFSGAVQEHVGMTQVVFPSFEPYYISNPKCALFPGLDPFAEVPDPWPLTDRLCTETSKSTDTDPECCRVQCDADGNPSTVKLDRVDRIYKNSRLLEAHEGNLVTFTDVAVATRFVSCDKNKNGNIDFGTDEITCRAECNDARPPDKHLCGLLEDYFEFSQYTGLTDGRKIVHGSVALADSFKPLDIDFVGGEDNQGLCAVGTDEDGFLEYICPPVTLSHMTGSLRHIYLCGDDSDDTTCDLQLWVIDPRFDGDIAVEGAP